jgi:hypothetical protein
MNGVGVSTRSRPSGLIDSGRSQEGGSWSDRIAVVSIVILGTLGTKVSAIFNQVVNDI